MTFKMYVPERTDFQPWVPDRIRKERALGTYLLASGDVLVILAGILSVIYLSLKKKAK